MERVAAERKSMSGVSSGLSGGLMRPMTNADIPGIHRVIKTIYESYGCIFDPQREDTYLLDPAPYFRGTGGEFWVVETGSEVFATGAVYLEADFAELKKLYVDSAIRCMGWGRRLAEAAINQARAAGRKRMVLWSDTRFRDAHRLYRRMGFREMGLRLLGDLSDSTEFGFEMDLR